MNSVLQKIKWNAQFLYPINRKFNTQIQQIWLARMFYKHFLVTFLIHWLEMVAPFVDNETFTMPTIRIYSGKIFYFFWNLFFLAMHLNLNSLFPKSLHLSLSFKTFGRIFCALIFLCVCVKKNRTSYLRNIPLITKAARTNKQNIETQSEIDIYFIMFAVLFVTIFDMWWIK